MAVIVRAFKKIVRMIISIILSLLVKRECREYKPVMERRRQRAQSAYKRGRVLPEVIQAASNGGRIQIHERSFSLLSHLHSQFTRE